MKKLLMAIPLIILFSFTFSCQQGEVAEEPVADVEADIQAIKDIIEEREAAVNAADIDKATSHYADDMVSIPMNRPALIGKEAILGRIQQIFSQFTLQEDYVVEDVKVSGNLAVAHFTFSYIATPKAGGEPIETKGNCIRVYERQSDGAWKCIYTIHSDERLIYPEQAKGEE